MHYQSAIYYDCFGLFRLLWQPRVMMFTGEPHTHTHARCTGARVAQCFTSMPKDKWICLFLLFSFHNCVCNVYVPTDWHSIIIVMIRSWVVLFIISSRQNDLQLIDLLCLLIVRANDKCKQCGLISCDDALRRHGTVISILIDWQANDSLAASHHCYHHWTITISSQSHRKSAFVVCQHTLSPTICVPFLFKSTGAWMTFINLFRILIFILGRLSFLPINLAALNVDLNR